MEKTLTDERIYTYNDLLFLPEGNYEIINGKHINMSPTGFIHGEIEGIFYKLLEKHLGKKGYVAVGEVGIVISKKPFRLRAADVVYISKETSPQKPEGILEIAPDMIIEILSPDDTVQKMNDKINDYLSIGVGKIIVVDRFNESVSIYHHKKKQIDIYNFDEEFVLIANVKLIMNQIL
ncbi:MAG: Uma2 family endonuclease [Cytophagales bacterium]|nr:Uma2 family endonuclease [Cytophagales bacterium]